MLRNIVDFAANNFCGWLVAALLLFFAAYSIGYFHARLLKPIREGRAITRGYKAFLTVLGNLSRFVLVLSGLSFAVTVFSAMVNLIRAIV